MYQKNYSEFAKQKVTHSIEYVKIMEDVMALLDSKGMGKICGCESDKGKFYTKEELDAKLQPIFSALVTLQEDMKETQEIIIEHIRACSSAANEGIPPVEIVSSATPQDDKTPGKKKKKKK